MQERIDSRHIEIEKMLARAAKSGTKAPTTIDIAKALGVSAPTISNDLATMKKNGRLLKQSIPKNQQMRDEVFEQATSTLDTLNWLIDNCREMMVVMREEMGVDTEPCPCCGHKNLRADSLKWGSFFKGMDSLVNQLTLKAKVLGEITDSPQTTIMQADADVLFLTQAIMKGDADIAHKIKVVLRHLEQLTTEIPSLKNRIEPARELLLMVVKAPVGRIVYNQTGAISPRRINRTPEYITLQEATVEGEFHEI